MTSDPFAAQSHGELFATNVVRALLSEERRVAQMVRVEIALARANARCGVIPEAAARAIEAALAGFEADLSALGVGTEFAGVPVPALVAQLRAAVGSEAADCLHWGATSQDIADTALVLVLRDVLDHLDAEIAAAVDAFADLARRHRDTVMLARTRMQQAAPTTLGLKVVGWRQPLVRCRVRLGQLRPRLLVLQLGGGAGTLGPLGGKGPAVRLALADELGLAAPAMPWHTQRDGFAEFAGWLSLVTGALGTVGLDIGLLAQSEVAEVTESAESGRGGSSTLPQKSNPVGSEILVALARHNANALGAMHQALMHEGERSGAAWSLEWLTLPGMILAVSGALAHGNRLAAGLVVDAGRMRENLEATNGLCLAEGAVFALSAHMPRNDARALVAAACRKTAATGQNLITLLREETEAPISWQAVENPEDHLGSAAAFVDAALAD